MTRRKTSTWPAGTGDDDNAGESSDDNQDAQEGEGAHGGVPEGVEGVRGDAFCPRGRNGWIVCEVTEDKHELAISDAVVFVADRLNYLDVPSLRTDFQRWVFWARYPHHTRDVRKCVHDSLGTGCHDSLYQRFGANMFTWTMAYRDDADIVVPYKTWSCGPETKNSLSAILKQPLDNLTFENRKGAAWIVGSCEQYFFEKQILSLDKDGPFGCRQDIANASTNATVAIRLFPNCGGSECSSRGQCLRRIAENYNFIFVSLKPECFQSPYELIYDAFEHNIVPVVLAPPNSKLNVPEHSVVNSADFRERGELAAKLRDLLSDRTMYESYFAWKRNCSLTYVENELCPLCTALWERSMDHLNLHPNVYEWWDRRLVCQHESLHGLDTAFISERE
ncbi:hypothetical protein HPB50_018052 [Hyalomma asiaticum]|uniref:Uncharacterized protein n=1 Tax=Hyalomma asiaticum TaxID=266040 RepID=A0ACB7TI81_HYAAI|nr:hypothetical protein HPB50_018052 [Hyalomma asiaticum]